MGPALALLQRLGSSPQASAAMTRLYQLLGRVGSAQKALTAGPYAKVPDTLMGFAKQGIQRGFGEQRYPFELPVRVQLPGMESWEDAVSGLNFTHAMERALRNWPGASIEPLINNLLGK